MIVPVIEAWMAHTYAKVPAVPKVCAYVLPLDSVPLLVKLPSMLFTV